MSATTSFAASLCGGYLSRAWRCSEEPCSLPPNLDREGGKGQPTRASLPLSCCRAQHLRPRPRKRRIFTYSSRFWPRVVAVRHATRCREAEREQRRPPPRRLVRSRRRSGDGLLVLGLLLLSLVANRDSTIRASRCRARPCPAPRPRLRRPISRPSSTHNISAGPSRHCRRSADEHVQEDQDRGSG